MYKQFEQLDEKLILNANQILEEMGLDVVTAIRMTLKRIIKDENISFLLASQNTISSNDKNVSNAIIEQEQIKMTKNKAISLFKKEGVTFNNNITFASKNKGAYNYWANPDFDVLDNQWNLILNDWLRKELYLFVIPVGTVTKDMLVCRNDMRNKIDLQIMYEDISFTDMRSKVSFANFLSKKIEY